MLSAWLAVAMMLAAVTVASAEPLVSLEPAPDGTLVLIGRGWRPGQKLVVSAGPDVFAATADTVGDFEVQTGMPASGGPPIPLAVRRPDPTSLAFTALPLPALSSQPDPFAVLFVQAVATGAITLAASAATLAAATLAARRVRRANR